MTDEPIRVIHFADVHIGMENYGKTDPTTGISSRVMDFLRRLTDLVDFAEEHDVDLAIFAGDAFKSSNPNPTYQREFARRIKRLTEQCPVVLLVGNHDIPAMTQKASSIEIFQTLEVDGVMVGRTDQLYVVDTKRGLIQVATVPYPVRQRVLSHAATRGLNLAQIDAMLREQVDQIIRNLAQEVDPEIPAVLTGHFTVQGAQLGSERGVMLGRDVAVLKSTLDDPAWDYVALGHIHYHQDMNNGNYPSIVYSGSMERIDFGEEGDPKGFCYLEVLRGATTWEFIDLPVREFITIRADVRKHDDPTAGVLRAISKHDVTDAVVRVIITASPESEHLLRDRDIHAALTDAAYIGGVQRDIDYPVRSRLGVERPEELTPLELLDNYFITRDVGPDRREVLIDYAQTLLDDHEE